MVGILIILLSLPIVILIDSKRRLGERSRGWAIGMFILELSGLSQLLEWKQRMGDTPSWLTTVPTLWLTCFLIYRVCTAKPGDPSAAEKAQELDSSTRWAKADGKSDAK